ncbi:MAG: hypothetical protein WCV82_04230 [Candidatus Paceibacterota bacterium]
MKAIALFGAHDHSKLDAWLRIVREHGGTFLPEKTALMVSGHGITHRHKYVRVVAHIPPKHKESFELCVSLTGICHDAPCIDDLHMVPYIKKTLHPMWWGPHEEA